MRRVLSLIGVVLVLAACPFASVAAAARNCELVSPPNTGETATYGFQPDQVEITFCGNRRLADAELQQFMAAERLTLVTISSDIGRTQNAYYFRIAPGVTVGVRVRQLAENADIRSVGVVPIGAATGGQTATPPASVATLPSTATNKSGGPNGTALIGVACLGIAGAVFLARRRRAAPGGQR